MEKEYKQPEKQENNEINEPMAEYCIDKETLPVLTEEEMNNCITTEELLEDVNQYIHELFSKK